MVTRENKLIARRQKMELRQKRANNKLHKNARIATWIISIFLISLIGYSIFTVIHKYTSTVDWNHQHANQVLLSKQDPTLLNTLSTEQNTKTKKLLLSFTKQYHQLYDESKSDLKKYADKSSIQKFKETYAQIPKNRKSVYRQKYNTVKEKFTIETDYRNLFLQYPDKLKADITPQQIKDINDKYFNKISELTLNSNNQDAFAKRIYHLQQTLASDATKIDALFGILDQLIVKNSKNTYVLKNTAFTIDKDQLLLTDLNYYWSSLKNTRKFLHKLDKVLTYQTEKHAKWVNYQNDLNAHQSAIDSLNKLKQSDKLSKQQANDTVIANLQSRIASLQQELKIQQEIANRRNARIRVPDFTDKPLKLALTWLKDHNLKSNVTYQKTDDSNLDGQIINTNAPEYLYPGYADGNTLDLTVYQYEEQQSK